MSPVATIIINILSLVQLLMIVRILLSWFPGINWYNQPFRFLNNITEPIFAPFRRIIPPLGGMIDISPIIPFIIINFMIKGVYVFFSGAPSDF